MDSIWTVFSADSGYGGGAHAVTTPKYPGQGNARNDTADVVYRYTPLGDVAAPTHIRMRYCTAVDRVVYNALLERVRIVPDLGPAIPPRCEVDRHDVETTHRPLRLVDMKEALGDLLHRRLFRARHRLFGQPIGVRASPLYLDEDIDIAIEHDKVDLSDTSEVKVPFHKAVPQGEKERQRQFLELRSCCPLVGSLLHGELLLGDSLSARACGRAFADAAVRA